MKLVYAIGLPVVVTALSLTGDGQSKQRIFKVDGGFDSPPRDAPFHDSCPLDAPLSCSNRDTEDTCCYEGTNGVFLLAQLWDYKPAIGANDTFTMHGLWCDKCRGGFNQFCNPGWEVHSVPEVLKSTNNTDLLDEMKQVWLNLNGNDEHLWLHEFNKHGTCMASVNPGCYDKDASRYQYAADFYTTSMDIWRELPTFDWLQEAGIHPSTEKTFTVEEFQSALAPKLGVNTISVSCNRHNALTEVYYYFNLKGSVANGQFVPRNAFNKGSCKDGFKWLPKGSNDRKPPPGHKPSTRGYLKPSNQQGCMISNGHWYNAGTCATFRVRKAEYGGVELRSSKGPCNIVNGQFSCGPANTAGQFTLKDGKVTYGGETQWSADEPPHATTQVPIRPGDDGVIKFELKFESK